MKRLLALLLAACLLTACTPRQMYSNYQLRQTAQQLAKRADAMALVTVGDALPSYELGGDVYTDYEVTVVRGQSVKPGDKLKIRRHGGSITVPGTETMRVTTVDYAYHFPEKGGEVFLLLRKVGEKYEIIDAMTLRGGQPTSNRPEHQVYLPYLNSLQ
ncbi:MAG TPA: hypothetical protein VD973_21365 [Symbiobacteriaceae bacterium]|nr:hypothetical protein [Symbiobacteriaceae bacterium]